MMGVPHIGFIMAAYGVTAAVMFGMLAAILLDTRKLTRALDRLDPRRAGEAGRGGAGGPRAGRP